MSAYSAWHPLPKYTPPSRSLRCAVVQQEFDAVAGLMAFSTPGAATMLKMPSIARVETMPALLGRIVRRCAPSRRAGQKIARTAQQCNRDDERFQRRGCYFQIPRLPTIPSMPGLPCRRRRTSPRRAPTMMIIFSFLGLPMASCSASAISAMMPPRHGCRRA